MGQLLYSTFVTEHLDFQFEVALIQVVHHMINFWCPQLLTKKLQQPHFKNKKCNNQDEERQRRSFSMKPGHHCKPLSEKFEPESVQTISTWLDGG
jgi:hypothetical protein